MSGSTLPSEKKKLPIAKLAIGAGILLLVLAVVLQIVGWRNAWDAGLRVAKQGMDLVTSAGPGVFFTAMALLPALGMPMLAFSLTAGPLFGGTLGFGWVIFWGMLALVANLTFTYLLARRWLRPWLTKLVQRLGYKMPEVPEGDATGLIVLLRVTPGVPFFVQNYLLGLADVPFGKYMAISCGIQCVQNTGFILFGDALAKGKGKMALTAIGLLAAAAAATNLIRRHYGKKNQAA